MLRPLAAPLQAATSLRLWGLGKGFRFRGEDVGGGVYIVCLVFPAVSAISRVGWGGVRVSRAYADQSIHAQTIIPFVYQEHTLTRASMPEP